MLRETENLLKAAADRTRLRILAMLGDQPLCVCQVVEVLGLSQSTVSKHLSLLAQAGLIVDERRGRWTYYALVSHPRGSPEAKLLDFVRESLAEDPDVVKDVKMTCCDKVRDLVRNSPRAPSRRTRGFAALRGGARG